MFESAPGKPGASSQSEPDAERAVKIEQLLLAGLDHYFKGRYERAIDVWTRVLFLDRSHARARAYIDRARAALAERLREAEELVHTGAEALDRGAVGEARALLTSAVERGGGRDEALVLLDRLNRLETAAGGETGPLVSERHTPSRTTPRVAATPPQASRVRVGPLILLAGAVVVSVYAAMGWERWWPLLPATPPTPVSAMVTVAPSEPLPVPAPAELALARARRFITEQRYAEALEQTALVESTHPLADEANRVRAEIQQTLLTRAGVGAAADDGAEAPPGP